MKNPVMSFWLSAANQAAGWWTGHAANEIRRQQKAALTAMAKPASVKKSRRKRRPRRKAV